MPIHPKYAHLSPAQFRDKLWARAALFGRALTRPEALVPFLEDQLREGIAALGEARSAEDVLADLRRSEEFRRFEETERRRSDALDAQLLASLAADRRERARQRSRNLPRHHRGR